MLAAETQFLLLAASADIHSTGKIAMARPHSVVLYLSKVTPVLPGGIPPWVFCRSLALWQSRRRREFPNQKPAKAAKTLKACRFGSGHNGTRNGSKDKQFHDGRETSEVCCRSEYSGRNIQRGKWRNTIPCLPSFQHVLDCHGVYTKPFDFHRQQAPSDKSWQRYTKRDKSSNRLTMCIGFPKKKPKRTTNWNVYDRPQHSPGPPLPSSLDANC